MRHRWWWVMLASIASAWADADSEALFARLREQRPLMGVTSVAPTPIRGLYEIVMGRNLAYADADARFLFFGHMLDISTFHDLTADRKAELARVRFSDLPLQNSITYVQGGGRRSLAVFSDPDCPYCRRLEADLTKLDDVTIHVFPLPIQSLHPGAAGKVAGIWCSPERAKTWREVLVGAAAPRGFSEDCMAVVTANIALADKLGFRGTPTLVSGDGRVLSGALSAQKISAWLDSRGPE